MSGQLQRNHSADLLKGMLIVLVIVGHVFVEPVLANPTKKALYLFHMPLFLALSGYLWSGMRTPGEEATRAWPRYLRPWVLATLGYALLQLAQKGRVSFTLESAVRDPWYHLWFIPCLFLCQQVASALRGWGPWALVSLCALPVVLKQLGFDPMSVIGAVDKRFVFFAVYFALGYACRSLFAKVSPRWFVLLLVPAAAAALLTHPHYGSLEDGIRFAACIGVLGAVAAFPNAPSKISDTVFSRESLAIYLIHPAPMLLLRRRLVAEGPLVHWMGSLLIGLVLVPVAVILLRKVRGSAVFLGVTPSGGPANSSRYPSNAEPRA